MVPNVAIDILSLGLETLGLVPGAVAGFIHLHPDAFTVIFGLLCGWLGYRQRYKEQKEQQEHKHKELIRRVEEMRDIALRKLNEERAALLEDRKTFEAERQRYKEQKEQHVITPGTAFSRPKAQVVELSYYVNGAKRFVRKDMGRLQ